MYMIDCIPYMLGMNYLHYEAPLAVVHRDLKSKNGTLHLIFVSVLKQFVWFFFSFILVVIAMDLTAKVSWNVHLYM